VWSEESVMMNGINDELTLAARLLLATLFLIFGYRKLRDFSGTVSQMVQQRPSLACVCQSKTATNEKKDDHPGDHEDN
jgi:hypothetical protein